jgi:hypothetical protein
MCVNVRHEKKRAYGMDGRHGARFVSLQSFVGRSVGMPGVIPSVKQHGWRDNPDVVAITICWREQSCPHSNQPAQDHSRIGGKRTCRKHSPSLLDRAVCGPGTASAFRETGTDLAAFIHRYPEATKRLRNDNPRPLLG